MRRKLLALLMIVTMTALSVGVRPVSAEMFGGVDFPNGASSFADVVVDYSPADFTPGNPPLNSNSANFTGAPDDADASLGNGGYVILQFTDNALTGSGDGTPDLHIFETGSETEATDIEVSADGSSWTYVGQTAGGADALDIDAAGFGPSDKLYYVRITDVYDDNFEDPDNFGDEDRTGADIDALGAIASADPAPILTEGEVTVEVHARECPAGATSVYEECHPYGVAGVEVTLALASDETVTASGVTDADGNVILAGFPGDWMLYGTFPDGYTGIAAYCSFAEDLGTETYIEPNEDGSVTVVDGDYIYCDLYMYGDGVVDNGSDNGSGDDGGSDDGGTDDGGTELPETGIGPAADSFALLPLGLLALAAGSVAVANRRRAIR